MQKPNRSGACEKVNDPIDTAPISKAELMDTRADARHRTRERHRKRMSLLEPGQRIGKFSPDILRELLNFL
jgi:hypothetical protein